MGMMWACTTWRVDARALPMSQSSCVVRQTARHLPLNVSFFPTIALAPQAGTALPRPSDSMSFFRAIDPGTTMPDGAPGIRPARPALPYGFPRVREPHAP